MNNPHPFELWFLWLDSPDGRLHRRTFGDETDYDLVGTGPNPPGAEVLTVGLLREAVELMRRGREVQA